MVTTTYHRPTLNLRIYNFVRDVIRHRNLLISRQISTNNLMKSLRIIEQLTRNNNKGYTEKASALFFLNNADDIRYLIKNDDREKISQFEELLEKSNIFSKL